MYSFRSLFNKTTIVYLTEGLPTALKRGLSFIVEHIFWYNEYYILERPYTEDSYDPEPYKPDIPELSSVFITSIQQADEIARVCEDFRKYFIKANKMLTDGAVASCVYVGKEIAFVGWVATTEAAKKAFNNVPYRVDFANNEACTGNVFTIPKFRRKGIKKYGTFLRLNYMHQAGVVRSKSIVKTNNITSLKASNIKGNSIIAQARHIRFLFWDSWKETLLNIQVADAIKQWEQRKQA